MDRTGAANHPGLFKMLAPIAEQFQQDGFIDSGDAGGGSTTLSEVTTKINDLRDKMLKSERGSPEYKAMLDELVKLNALEADLMRK
jgi:hypothetical protein